jgi:hypothetical protein
MENNVRKSGYILILCFSGYCSAEQLPIDTFNINYQNSAQADLSPFNEDLSYISNISVKTYQYLDQAFSSFYKKLTFNTDICDNTLEQNAHHEIVAIPLLPINKEGLQLEVFGNFADPSSQYLSNLSNDHINSDYLANSHQYSISNQDMSIGAGVSFNTSTHSKIKIIISNTDLPGYGNSSALFAFETQF